MKAIRLLVSSLLALVWAGQAHAMTVEDRFKLHDDIVWEVSPCRWSHTPALEPEDHFTPIADLIQRIYGSGFVRLKLEPDGSLSAKPMIIEVDYQSRTFIEREARSRGERSMVEAIERCAPFRAVAAFSDRYADWKRTCIFLPTLSSADIYHIRGWHPCQEELPLGELLRSRFHNR